MFSKILLIVFLFLTLSAWYIPKAEAGAVTKGLVAYWPFDRATIEGEVVEDIWGDSNGEIKGDPEIDQGQVGEALLLDGDIDYVLVDSETINRDYSEITLECWAYINSLDDSWNRLISLDDMPANQNVATLYYDDDDNQHGFFVRASGNSTDAKKDLIQEDIPTEEWLHLVGTWDGKTVKYYVNGKLEITHSISGTIEGGGLFLGIGDRSDACNCDTIPGLIDEVRIYEIALSDREVKMNYNSEGLAITPANYKLSLTWGEIKFSR
jgi:hypothetical protein